MASSDLVFELALPFVCGTQAETAAMRRVCKLWNAHFAPRALSTFRATGFSALSRLANLINEPDSLQFTPATDVKTLEVSIDLNEAMDMQDTIAMLLVDDVLPNLPSLRTLRLQIPVRDVIMAALADISPPMEHLEELAVVHDYLVDPDDDESDRPFTNETFERFINGPGLALKRLELRFAKDEASEYGGDDWSYQPPSMSPSQPNNDQSSGPTKRKSLDLQLYLALDNPFFDMEYLRTLFDARGADIQSLTVSRYGGYYAGYSVNWRLASHGATPQLWLCAESLRELKVLKVLRDFPMWKESDQWFSKLLLNNGNLKALQISGKPFYGDLDVLTSATLTASLSRLRNLSVIDIEETRSFCDSAIDIICGAPSESVTLSWRFLRLSNVHGLTIPTLKRLIARCPYLQKVVFIPVDEVTYPRDLVEDIATALAPLAIKRPGTFKREVWANGLGFLMGGEEGLDVLEVKQADGDSHAQAPKRVLAEASFPALPPYLLLGKKVWDFDEIVSRLDVQ
ncbi:hypothetical protein HDU67_004262 [Dinochytrium kinnereticum]|nr:hypothetical protein HDU67_004262 [Dinochytrium kinnereticum]